MEHDARITNLEIKISFTEDMLDALNKALFRQQEQIDLLVREVDVNGCQEPLFSGFESAV